MRQQQICQEAPETTVTPDTDQTKDGVHLWKHNWTAIVRHTLVRADASPYDGNWTYWATRRGQAIDTPTRVAKLLKKQQQPKKKTNQQNQPQQQQQNQPKQQFKKKGGKNREIRCFTPILPRGFSMTIPKSYYIMVDHL